ncbi:MAG: hypothetical protein HY286_16725 [Planctomycetes bacterium]|nr:hypothetical protein [Planctomycetota bacterium]
MPTFAVELDFAGLLVEVRLNDVRVYRDSSGVPRIREDRVNHWIVPGPNLLEVWLGIPNGAEGEKADEPSFELEWFAWESSGSTRRDAERVAGYRYRQELQLPTGEMRRVWDASLEPARNFGEWAWQRADGDPLEAVDRAGIVQLLQRLHDGVSNRNITTVRKTLNIQNEEMARAFGLDARDRDTGQRAFLEKCVAAPRWRLEPLRPDELEFHSQAGGRLVFVTDKNGLPPVRGVSGSTTFDLPCGFSRLGGAWTIVR